MAITAAQLTTALVPTGNTVTGPLAIKEVPPYGGTLQYWYIDGGALYSSTTARYHGRARFVSTTASDNAATQATTVLTALAAGPTHQ